MGIMDATNELSCLIRDLAEANEALVEATKIGDIELVADFLSRVTLLERRRNRLVHQGSGAPRGRARFASYESAVPLRDQVIRALHLISRPATGRLLADVTRSRWEETIETTKLSSLRRDESRSWFASQDENRRTVLRDVYIVPALTYDRFAPVRGTLALSTWEMSRRLVAPLSPRVDMLRSTVALAREVERLAVTSQDHALRRLVGRLGATIPGIRPFGATMQQIMDAAEAELAKIEEIDVAERTVAAARATDQLDQDAILFGASFGAIVTGAAAGVR